jgi:hypothetical protein
MSSEKIYYVYVYRHPITLLPFYVGKGKADRMWSHLNETFETTENRKKYAVIKNLLNLGLSPIIGRYAKNLDEELAYQIEEMLIEKWGRRDFEPNGILTNICKDGRPPSAAGRKASASTKQKLSMSKIGDKNPMYGKTGIENPRYGKPGLSGELNGFYGRTHTIEVVNKIIESNKGRTGKFKQTNYQKEAVRKANCNVWRLISPDSVEYYVDDLKAFCREHQLIKSAPELLQRLHRQHIKTGKIFLWRGWSCSLHIAQNPSTIVQK